MIDSVTTLLRVVEMAAVLAMGCALYLFSHGERRRVLRLWSAGAVCFVVREGAFLALQRAGDVPLQRVAYLAIPASVAEFALIVLVVAGALELRRASAVPPRRLAMWIGGATVLATLLSLLPGITTRTAQGWSGVLAIACAVAILVAAVPVARVQGAGPLQGKRVLLAIVPLLVLERIASGYAQLASHQRWPTPGWLAWLPLMELLLIAVGLLATVVLLLEREQAETREQSAAAADAQRALADGQVWFQEMINGSTDIVTMLNESATILYESPSLGRVVGWKAEDLVGQSGLTYVHDDDREATAAAFFRVVRREAATARVKYRFRARDGRYRILESEGREIAPSGGERRFVVTSRDVTEREELEERLLHSEKMESVGRLAGGVAHDFNNLLTVVLSNAQMAADELPLSSPLRDLVESIREAAQRGTALTRQLLAFARKQAATPAALDLGGMVKGLGRLLQRLLGERVALGVRLDPALWRIWMDPGQLEQVLVNLAVNARDAMPEGGRLTVTARNETLPATEAWSRGLTPGDNVHVVVTDTGHGMDESTRVRVFEPFFTTKGDRGTGLGLATSLGIVQQAGGAIWVESEPGRGAAFHLLLPRYAEPLEAATPPPARATASAPATVLVVEDDEGVRRVAARSLRRAGYGVLSASSGPEALRLAAEHGGPIDLLLSDVGLPGMSGPELADRLVAARPGLRVAFVSGYAPGEAERASVPAGAAPVLPKPYVPEDLVAWVAGLVGEAPGPVTSPASSPASSGR
jgi:PAS domain S-box-containing protein